MGHGLHRVEPRDAHGGAEETTACPTKAVGLVENVTREKEMELSLEHLAQTERSIEA